ncbi:C-C motif chemokine 3-like 1 [Engraulis encrasicolus]|uniref:C-C motif chemokine 3-like 1 n=1 Tax=Engraulis encrasicolus TaxID=184585 RepID=UPI002FD0F427
MVQIPVPALALIILITMGLLYNEADARPACCTQYSSYRVPAKYVRGYRIQDNKVCRLKAVELITSKGRKVCADPNQDWVMEIMVKLPVKVINMRTHKTKG